MTYCHPKGREQCTCHSVLYPPSIPMCHLSLLGIHNDKPICSSAFTILLEIWEGWFISH